MSSTDDGACELCNSKFTFFKRKHICRGCEKVVCSSCSPHRTVILSISSEPIRICFVCKAKELEGGSLLKQTSRFSPPQSPVSNEPLSPISSPLLVNPFNNERVNHQHSSPSLSQKRGYPWELSEEFVDSSPWQTKGTVGVTYKITTLSPNNLIPGTPQAKEFNRVTELANYTNPNFKSQNLRKITRIDVVVNEMLEQRFVSKHELIIPFIKKAEFNMEWKSASDSESRLRQKYYFTHTKSFPSYSLNGKNEANLTPAWHGVSDVKLIESICETGFMALSKLDSGWFGKGIYFTHFSDYAFYYSKGTNVLLLAWVIQGLSYPIVEDPGGKRSFLGKPCMSGYHSHYVAVSDYKPVQANRKATADEIVIFQEDQILPRYIVYFEGAPDSIPTTPSTVTLNESKDTSLLTLKDCNFISNGDTNGVIYYLVSKVTVTCSGIGKGSVDGFISREMVHNWTTNSPNSWFCVDLGPGKYLTPTYYTIRYASRGNTCCPRNWKLQACNELPLNMTIVDDPNWVTIRNHVDDRTLDKEFAIASFPLNCSSSYRYFRIIQTAKNVFVPVDGTDLWSDVLVASHFELYGHLTENSPAVPKQSSPPSTPSTPTTKKSISNPDGIPKGILSQSEITTPGTRKLDYSYTGDKNGLVYHLGYPTISVTSSSNAKGTPQDLLNREKSWCWTKNEQNAWFCVDLGPSCLLKPSYYTLGYGSGGNFACPRNWKLQGSNTGNPFVNSTDPSWETLYNHTNDTSIHSEFGRASWSLSASKSYRYFRIIQTGRNCYIKPTTAPTDAWGNVFVVSGFEIYGTLTTGAGNLPTQATAISKSSIDLNSYQFTSTHDGKGLVSKLGVDSFTVTSSSLVKGKPSDFLSKAKVFCWTANKPFSWICVDIGADKLFKPNHYTLGYGSNGSYVCPRNWKFQGSIKNEPDTGVDDPNWITIRSHTNDTSINGPHMAVSWPVTCSQYFRFFRIIMTGKNSYIASTSATDNWSNVLVASGFELYGELKYVTSPSNVQKQPQPVKSIPILFQPTTNSQFKWKSILDTNGIIYHLGKEVNVYASSIAKGSPEYFISRSKQLVWTQNQPNSWFAIDLGEQNRAEITHYTLGYGGVGDACLPRNWKLQGSNHKEAIKFTDLNDPNWITIRKHVDDGTLNVEFRASTWVISNVEAYRFFRIIQYGTNSFKPIDNENWYHILAVTNFEIYGTLYSGSISSLNKDPDPSVSTPSSSTQLVEKFEFEKTFDTKGIIYNTGSYSVHVTCSSIKKGVPLDFLSRDKAFVWTDNIPNSWFCVDFGPNRRVLATHYSLCYGSSGNYVCPRNWVLQGSNSSSSGWKTLNSHVNDTSINGDFAPASWSVQGATESYRYFRIVQTGKNAFKSTTSEADRWSNAFVVAGFEIYGTLYTNLSTPKPLHDAYSKEFNFSNLADMQGIIATLGSNQVAVTSSSLGKGSPIDFLSRKETYCWTLNQPNAWFIVDLGPNRFAFINHYRMAYGSTGSFACPRNWALQGSNAYSASSDAFDSHWTTIRSHSNDKSINGGYVAADWKLHPQGVYRYFRIIMTGKNSYNIPKEGKDDWSNALVAIGFDIYGTLYTF